MIILQLPIKKFPPSPPSKKKQQTTEKKTKNLKSWSKNAEKIKRKIFSCVMVYDEIFFLIAYFWIYLYVPSWNSSREQNSCLCLVMVILWGGQLSADDILSIAHEEAGFVDRVVNHLPFPCTAVKTALGFYISNSVLWSDSFFFFK